MTQNKRNSFEFFNLPEKFSVAVLTLSFILLIGPYLEGLDFGVFKIPTFAADTKKVLQYLGPPLFIFVILLFVRFWKSPDTSDTKEIKEVESNSKFRLQSISDIVKNEARKNGINIDGIHIGDRLTISDLERICTKTYYPNQPSNGTCTLLENARGMAFTKKYAEPKEDEKLVNISQIKLEGLKQWEAYFWDLLKDLGINDLSHIDILNVGIGNGYADYELFKNVPRFKAVDISPEALNYAANKLSNMQYYVCSAENLFQVPNGSIDLYLSFRTFQSTLFDRRAAVHEAYRVLRKGGIAIISVPVLYLKKNGEVLQGLIPPGSYEPNLDYATAIADRIKDYMDIMNFKEVDIDSRSPFEIYICGKR
ncbi:SAM-dependent methyltransferase [Desulfosalsimonas propionicica]|uniref:SAM-dependent methyltransferase n=1 Tax=Desulfosalsimonas propionicica TaxID=332175 RepID=A0A7W0C884_9BACT|nr:class I SAM-dependent methyltransferase [Desulfosalsimonas propionicica]MBA2880900.1 SAM-dependent methyltransferase [Desulfosalsimonas propionicica]